MNKLPSQSEINEWRENPVTVALATALRGIAAMEKQSVTDAFWNGAEVSERQRLHAMVRREMIEDLFDLDEVDLKAAMEKIDEHQRHSADGIQGAGQAQGG